ncbi:isochorismate lyase [Commensalibacter communis]|uniref:chorismate mutase n=1 Tax=Commensalibacter communis TaxID=2972786 RepID=A0A9W4TQB0_9PROT|nr:isochorismate lyase [Commensalibacter communis]CAI3955468.1 Chorismate mutase (PheA) (PDB:1ECM) [Commensalibacter communis]CAI3957158.1 Chorismate mutase (PheA) (PDB:1ECM) [Commensalibacter communis]CAI3957494.1 Chorismate mutase (PheA) (PDB:1ECM) [Commensalibacter communis]CAI3957647.1 Chorismate mutase (PheA) (PDB:1ECM) [Commensalibacter communis]CAI3958196.1 Chorismate mutase (PheA) (PDB:1ECM) [Commensalibacter communis]
MKAPNQCKNLEDVRVGIDAIDKEIITLLSRRLGYVLTAANYKKTEADIPAPERVKVMLKDRRSWAQEAKISSEFITALFEHIIQWYINTQILHWRELDKTKEKKDGF